MPSVPFSPMFAKPEVQKAVKKLRRVLRSVLPDGVFAEREQAALEITEEVVRGVLEEDLQRIGDSFGEHVLVAGIEYRRHEEGTGEYHSLCGSLSPKRATYRKVGVRNGPTIVPLELEAGLVEHATPALGESVAHGYGCHDMRLHGEVLRTARRTPPPRATLERIATRVAQKAVTEAPKIEKKIRRRETLPDGAHAIVVGLDRTSVPMVEDRPDDAPPKPEPVRRTPLVRTPPKPFDVNWRMAYVGTVCVVDRHGLALHTTRYAAAACDEPKDIVDRMMEDVRTARRREPLRVGVMQDGAHEMWNLVRAGLTTLREHGILRSWNEGIDRPHLLERLAAALEIAEPNTKERPARLESWMEDLAKHDGAIDTIESFLKLRSYTVIDPAKRKVLDDHLTYLDNNKDRMRYVTLRRRGLPIGSGVTESAAKTVIGKRTKGAGQRWREQGLRGVLTLRAVHQSDRFPEFWTFLSRCYVANIQDADAA